MKNKIAITGCVLSFAMAIGQGTSNVGATVTTIINKNELEVDLDVPLPSQEGKEKQAETTYEVVDTPTETTSDAGVCNMQGNQIKAYMDYTTITDYSSPQYAIVSQASPNEYGAMVYDGYICVALGSVYGGIGTKYRVTLDSGQVLNVIKADAKSDAHTTNGCYNFNGSILEVINCQSATPTEILTMGNYDVVYKGNIVKIEVINN